MVAKYAYIFLELFALIAVYIFLKKGGKNNENN